MKHKSKVLAASAAIAIGLSLITATPAEACEEPHPTPSPTTTSAPSSADSVRVTQQAAGSSFCFTGVAGGSGRHELSNFQNRKHPTEVETVLDFTSASHLTNSC